MGIDISIDQFTPCLQESKTGELVKTFFSKVDVAELMALKDLGWHFDWVSEECSGFEVYKLTIDGENEIQGLIAVQDSPKNSAIYVKLVESAPHNSGRTKLYLGVGAHLFAIGAKLSKDRGYGGFMYMDAKNPELVEYYKRKLGATHIYTPHPFRMYIDESAAEELLRIYTLEEGLT